MTRAPKPPGYNAKKANLGKAWESILDEQHVEYLRARSAIAIRLYPPHRQLRRNTDGSALVRYTEPGPCDYIASTRGETFYLDAKDTEADEMSLAMVKDHQAAKLSEMEAMNASNIGGILLRLGITAAPRHWFVPWMSLRGPWTRWNTTARVKPGENRVGLDWLARNAIPMRGGSDWLSAAIQFSRGTR
jgi:penicillin-binding protein-related factor A (putative recombinase)